LAKLVANIHRFVDLVNTIKSFIVICLYHLTLTLFIYLFIFFILSKSFCWSSC